MNQEESTRQQFDLAAKAYSTAPLFARGHDLKLIVEAANPTPDWQVLDIGCGAGHTAFALAPHVKQVVGVDLSPGMLAEAKHNLKMQGFTNVCFQEAMATALPFRNGQFDLVTCRFVAHHLTELAPVLTEVCRVLKPSGQFLAVDVVSPEEDDLAQFVNHLERLRDPSHYWEWKISQWQAAIAAAGMTFSLLHQWRLPIDFEDWVTRQQTPTVAVRELETLLDHAPDAIRVSLELEKQPKRSFRLWAALMQGVHAPFNFGKQKASIASLV